MKIYVDEMPKSCENCPFCEYFDKDAHGKGRHEVACFLAGTCENILFGNKISPKNCPLESIADHDKKVKDKLLEDVWEIMEKITFDWYEDDDNINSELYIDADDIADILTDFETMSKEEVIEKHKWRFDKSVENSQNSQKSSTGGEE